MTYQKGQVIRATDFDDFLTTTSNVYGVGTSDRGYGQTGITQATVNVGDAIRAAQWTNLRGMIIVCGNHQGTDVSDLPPGGVFAIGETIIAHEQSSPSSNAYEMSNNITNIDIARLNTSMTSLSVAANVWTVTRGSNWTGSITAEISVLWANEDDARYYFNSGGQIRIHGSQPTGSGHPQDIHWNDSLTNKVGTVKFGVHTTTNTGTSNDSNAIGYYELTNSYQAIYSGTLEIGGAYYSSDTFTINAKRLNFVGTRGGNGNGVQLQIILNDAGMHYSTALTSSGTTFSFDNVKATTFLSGILSPTYATITPL